MVREYADSYSKNGVRDQTRVSRGTRNPKRIRP